MPKHLSDYTISELEAVVSKLGHPKFRAKQIYEWVHKHRVGSYEAMSNIPKTLREELSAAIPFLEPTLFDKQVSSDGTRKYLLEYADSSLVETVGLPVFDDNGEIKRLTVCFSTQIGCAMNCAFCATGKEGFSRNVSAFEMIDQIKAVERDFGHRVTNIVAMGQGEPFANYDEVMKALRTLNSPDDFNIGARHITVSTCGIVPGIKKFSLEPEQFTLAVSLHSAIQEKRDHLMPGVKNQPLNLLKKALQDYINKTNRRVTFEYLLIKGLNDRSEDLRALIDYCDGVLCHVNILPMNKIDGSPYQPANRHTVEFWLETLENNGIEATLRQSRGSDISGACGQLKHKVLS